MTGPAERHRRRVSASVIVAVFIVLAAVTVALGILARNYAEDRKTQRAQIASLIDQQEQNNRTMVELRAQIAALKDQVRQLGGMPVIVHVEPAQPRSTFPTTTQPRRPTTTTSTTAKPTTTSTTAPRRCELVVLCP